MYILTNKGYFDIVGKREDGKPSGPNDNVTVRFRRRKDALNLFSLRRITPTPEGDYPFRVFARREEIAALVSAMITDINYPSFKKSTEHDPKLHDAAVSSWSVFGRLQPGGPYGGPYGGKPQQRKGPRNERRN